MNFLPDDYEIPQSGGRYTKFKDGETRIRIIGSPILGWEAWTTENKPVRVKMSEKNNLNIRQDLKPRSTKHFWAFLIWNFETNQIEVCQITQKTIQESIIVLSKSNDWGDPKSYDIVVHKSGKELDTEYKVNGTPKSQLDPDKVREAFKSSPAYIEALYEGGDPWDLDEITKATVIQKFEKEFNDLPF